MKRVTCIIVFITAAIPLQAQQEKGFQKNAFSVTATPFTAYYWIHPGIIADEEWGSEPKRTQLRMGGTYGLSYHRELHRFFSLHCGLQYTYEEFSYYANLRTGNGTINAYTIRFNQSFLEIPLGLRIYPTHTSRDNPSKDGLFIQLDINPDFLISEHSKQSATALGDPHFNYQPGTSTVTEESSANVCFYRVYAVAQIGQVIGSNRFSFFYAGRLQTTPFFQAKDTQQYRFMNCSAGLVIGVTCRF